MVSGDQVEAEGLRSTCSEAVLSGPWMQPTSVDFRRPLTPEKASSIQHLHDR